MLGRWRVKPYIPGNLLAGMACERLSHWKFHQVFIELCFKKKQKLHCCVVAFSVCCFLRARRQNCHPNRHRIHGFASDIAMSSCSLDIFEEIQVVKKRLWALPFDICNRLRSRGNLQIGRINCFFGLLVSRMKSTVSLILSVTHKCILGSNTSG